MHNDVLPFFDEHRVRVKTVLSDNGREFCGRPDRHPYELFLQLGSTPLERTLQRRPILGQEECHGKAKEVQRGV